jgi:hypothetical protein
VGAPSASCLPAQEQQRRGGLFSPALPPAKARALEALRIGDVEKLFLHFPAAPGSGGPAAAGGSGGGDGGGDGGGAAAALDFGRSRAGSAPGTAG